MKILFDSSVLVAGMFAPHTAHAESVRWLDAAKAEAFEFIVAGHSLAEIYAVLTRYPVKPPLPPTDVWQLIEQNVLAAASIVELAETDYRSALQRMVRMGLTGGVTYDALIAQAATLAGVDHLLTLNERDFRRIWPDAGNRILSPLTSSPPASDAH